MSAGVEVTSPKVLASDEVCEVLVIADASTLITEASVKSIWPGPTDCDAQRMYRRDDDLCGERLGRSRVIRAVQFIEAALQQPVDGRNPEEVIPAPRLELSELFPAWTNLLCVQSLQAKERLFPLRLRPHHQEVGVEP